MREPQLPPGAVIDATGRVTDTATGAEYLSLAEHARRLGYDVRALYARATRSYRRGERQWPGADLAKRAVVRRRSSGGRTVVLTLPADLDAWLAACDAAMPPGVAAMRRARLEAATDALVASGVLGDARGDARGAGA